MMDADTSEKGGNRLWAVVSIAVVATVLRWQTLPALFPSLKMEPPMTGIVYTLMALALSTIVVVSVAIAIRGVRKHGGSYA